ncbi:sugar phosphate isomerase/epimerase family protein [Dyadobacter fanqingshengii]|uniref:Sugar phosphate isomerase/epimerase n=1 Tax=Dyadobacter fanqingshengii TaxID=2906443 RepID=A0A9X1P8V4_9BACT|nr:sugar phosphate isomerase/epimerase family protein [Dyadobacter fanqingshengii]MCF0040526.1 sugar phosphate isomerase/epimerase [Dyadobacter fanqingshengii]USJ37733.1 sugar phosphate isomerase/epimerase [Dyadobacter fanqingshengii]
MMERRKFLVLATLSGVFLPFAPMLLAKGKKQRYKIAVIDLMILKRQKLSALPLAKEIGADGLEVDMGGLGNRPTFDNKLVDPEVRKQYLDKAKELNLEICSLAMTGFYSQSFAKRDGIEKTIGDCIETMKQMDIKTAFLPMGVQGDLVKNPELRPQIIERLKRIAPMAEKAGVVIGIETALSAEDEVKLLNEVGSKAIQIYFNFSNALEAGRDVSEELQILGKNRICQIHCTDKDGVWLEKNTRLDMKKVKATLDKMGWKGWLVIERSRDASKPQDVKGNFGANTTFMKSVFQNA